jgi:hypothetical protein
LVGFNNVGFDYPVLHYILKNKQVRVGQIYQKAMGIIEAKEEDRFAHLIKPSDVLLKQIDLFKIHHFDNRAKATSLKAIEFNMRSDTIEDLPFDVGINLTNEQKDTLIEYNKHDVLKTLDFYRESKGKIEFRENLTKKYNRDFMNHNDTKIGKDYFIMKLEEKDPNSCYKVVGGRRKMNQTRRSSIKLKECIFDYIKFERPEFNAILNWFKQQEIKETKGVFTDLLESDLGEVAQYAEMVVKKKKLFKQPTEKQIADFKKEKPSAWVEEVPLKSGKTSWYFMWRVAETLNVVINGLRIDFGVGGIHASLSSSIIRSDDVYQLVDLDVSSYYPNMSISNDLYPEHLGKGYSLIYKAMYEDRKRYAKGTDENATMKLALNGSYGDTNNQYSPFYDPKYTMTITIGGQLSLCMLAEQLLKIKDLSIIQMNTDGLTVKVPRSEDELLSNTYKQWEKTVKLELERVDYSCMFIRDVNNYIGLYTNGKVKAKGAYEYKDLEHHKNHSMLIVPMAAEHHLLGRGSVEDFIKGHSDKFDFMSRIKVPRSNKLISVDQFGIENKEQNISRYYVSNNGVDLKKIMPALEGGKTVKVWKDIKKDKTIETDSVSKEQALSKRIEKGDVVFIREYFKENEVRLQDIESGYKVTICNNIKNYNGDINYDYYIDQARKLIDLKEVKTGEPK